MNPFCINVFSTLVKPLSVVAVTFVGRELWVGMDGHSAASVFNMAQSFLGGKVVSCLHCWLWLKLGGVRPKTKGRLWECVC